MSEDVYSHGHHESVVRSHALRTAADSAAYLLPHLIPGRSVLDVGSGPGSITADFAEIVSPGRVTGVDREANVIAHASELAASRGLDNLDFRTGDIYNLEYDDDTFDVVHAHQILHHLTDPVAALKEMRRVANDGGIIAVREGDYGAMNWYPEAPALRDWMDLYQKIARGNGAEPNAGRRLLNWARQAGLTDIVPSATTWVYAAEPERSRFADSWAERILHSSFAEQALERGLANQSDLERIAEGFREWGQDPDGWFVMIHAEILASVQS
ncbi:methyltransferase domain-containing protein [Arthrobacter sp. H14]|uniref:methyltransferase domain-containing protein n=1 Tax=Arthrobacter sp. H14 TaxID=1312959 RepID=UPI00047BCABD|nr:methyltransferase domain-containing protein [Arthrobacter sp. H14]